MLENKKQEEKLRMTEFASLLCEKEIEASGKEADTLKMMLYIKQGVRTGHPQAGQASGSAFARS